MDYVEAPTDRTIQARPFVFMGGGITDCPDWQAELRQLMQPVASGTLFNPRRANWEMRPGESERQIAWEHKWLWDSDILLFWFSRSTLCPIVLYELGQHLARVKLSRTPAPTLVSAPTIIIGVEPGYKRAEDVRIQTGLIDKTIPIVSSLGHMAAALSEAVDQWSEEY